MSLLTDTDLEKIISDESKECSHEKIVICPYSEDCLTPIGYDLRVGNKATTSNNDGYIPLLENKYLTIDPGATALILTLENLRMPRNRMISGLIESKVTKVSEGLSHISTTVDPDWEGNLLIAVRNHSRKRIKIKYGEPFCTIIFIENKSASTRPCEKDKGRSDILIKKFEKEAHAAARKRRFFEYSPPIIIIIGSLLGWLIFKNNPGFVAVVAICVALSQLVPSIKK